uniref:Uncharacterized protein n=1 Tax=Opuntia streptacantha TaxID=393608 RepID=A0A7C9DQP0_OPUST
MGGPLHGSMCMLCHPTQGTTQLVFSQLQRTELVSVTRGQKFDILSPAPPAPPSDDLLLRTPALLHSAMFCSNPTSSSVPIVSHIPPSTSDSASKDISPPLSPSSSILGSYSLPELLCIHSPSTTPLISCVTQCSASLSSSPSFALRRFLCSFRSSTPIELPSLPLCVRNSIVIHLFY